MGGPGPADPPKLYCQYTWPSPDASFAYGRRTPSARSSARIRGHDDVSIPLHNGCAHKKSRRRAAGNTGRGPGGRRPGARAASLMMTKCARRVSAQLERAEACGARGVTISITDKMISASAWCAERAPGECLPRARTRARPLHVWTIERSARRVAVQGAGRLAGRPTVNRSFSLLPRAGGAEPEGPRTGPPAAFLCGH